MFAISNEISSSFAPIKPIQMPEMGSGSSLSRAELLEISQNISLYYAPDKLSSSQKLALLPVDPEHFYVYWDLGDHQDYALSQSMFNNELTLRIYSQLEGVQDSVQTDPLVEIPVHSSRSRQRIRLPVPKKSTSYSASIGKNTVKKEFVSLINANNTHAIQGVMDEDGDLKKDEGLVDSMHTASLDQREGNTSAQPKRSNYAGTNNSGKGKKNNSDEKRLSQYHTSCAFTLC